MRGKQSFFLYFMISLGLVITALFLWTAGAEKDAHFTPEYARTELMPLLQKEALTEEDYAVLFRQTGLGRTGVDELYRQGRQVELLYLQKRFFAQVEYECSQVNAVCRGERLITGEPEISGGKTLEKPSGSFLPTVRTGDILITFSGHVFGWRSGHAGIVVDAEKGLVLEATALGSNSEFCTLGHWKEYPSLALLRLKDSTAEEAEAVAAYAAECLTDIPYDLASFTGGRQVIGPSRQLVEEASVEPEAPAGTQCAHLVWLAFAHFGYDLDSDGGWIVTPADLYDSDLLEVIQLYGISPESIEK